MFSLPIWIFLPATRPSNIYLFVSAIISSSVFSFLGSELCYIFVVGFSSFFVVGFSSFVSYLTICGVLS